MMFAVITLTFAFLLETFYIYLLYLRIQRAERNAARTAEENLKYCKRLAEVNYASAHNLIGCLANDFTRLKLRVDNLGAKQGLSTSHKYPYWHWDREQIIASAKAKHKAIRKGQHK